MSKRVAGVAALLAAIAFVVPAARTRAADVGSMKGVVTSGAAKTPVAGAVVMIEGPSRAAPPDTHVVIDQKNDAFVPRVVAVAVGTTVDFPNHDAHLHNVSSSSRPNAFDLGMYGEGETKSTTFQSPGVVRVQCNVHPKMDAIVFVHRNPYVAVTDAHGVYTITGIPAGTYDVRTWDERLGERRDRIEILSGQVAPRDVRLGEH